MSTHVSVGWLRRLAIETGLEWWTRPSDSYTSDEVKVALRRPATDDRSRLIHDCLARLGTQIDSRMQQRYFAGIDNYCQRLPRILTLYRQGWEPAAIAAELSLFSTAAGVECALEATAQAVAAELNRRQPR